MRKIACPLTSAEYLEDELAAAAQDKPDLLEFRTDVFSCDHARYDDVRRRAVSVGIPLLLTMKFESPGRVLDFIGRLTDEDLAGVERIDFDYFDWMNWREDAVLFSMLCVFIGRIARLGIRLMFSLHIFEGDPQFEKHYECLKKIRTETLSLFSGPLPDSSFSGSLPEDFILLKFAFFAHDVSEEEIRACTSVVREDHCFIPVPMGESGTEFRLRLFRGGISISYAYLLRANASGQPHITAYRNAEQPS